MNNNEILKHSSALKPLPKPTALINSLPLDTKLIKAISEARQTIKRIIQGQDPRLLVIAGPCSLHEEHAALEYAERLKTSAARFENELYVVMRAYFSKPRTAEGWKGLVYDPSLDHSHNIEQGLFLTRKILIAINQFLPTASEFLDPFTPCYLQDLIAWCAIGARTAASQIHRELASGLPMPVGFKNSVDGNIQIAIHAVKTASLPHHYFGLNSVGMPALIQSTGNQDCHIILRGSLQEPNYSEAHIKSAVHELTQSGLNPRLMVDCSHDNCGKQYQRQIAVVDDLIQNINITFKKFKTFPLCGLMLESHLSGGRQNPAHPKTLVYGQSITDACLSWQETEPLLEKLALALKQHL